MSNHLKNKLLFFQWVLVGIREWRLEAVILRNAIHLLWNRTSFWPEAYQLSKTEWPVSNRDSHVSSALVLRSQAQGTMPGIFTWMLQMEIRTFGSILPTEPSLSPDKCLWKNSKYLGTADKPTPCSEKVMLAEGLHWHGHVILPCSFPKEFRKPVSCICPQALELGHPGLNLYINLQTWVNTEFWREPSMLAFPFCPSCFCWWNKKLKKNKAKNKQTKKHPDKLPRAERLCLAYNSSL